MEDKSKDQFVAELLEASLRRYRSEEPRAGLEGRILTHVLSSDHSARRWTWVWALGAATAGVLVIFALLQIPQHPAPAPSQEQVVVERTAPPAIPSPPTQSTSPKPSLRTARLSGMPARGAVAQPSRPAQFPTPAPLSEEERLLLVYAAQSPNAETENLTTNDLGIKPLEIPDIMIAKIEIKKIPKLTERD